MRLVLFFTISLSCVTTLQGQATDYNLLQNWASHPWKKDCGDSVPKPLQKNIQPDSLVDIFFIHPTSYIEKGKPFGQNAPVDNDELNKKTDEGSILYQASVFNQAGRLFAPRYRQAHLSSYFPNKNDTAKALQSFAIAYSDVKAAFEFYLQHYNNGRPIIIASHSQGTTHAKQLLKDFFDDKPLQSKLITAYIIGIPVEPDWFVKILPCNKPSQTGCFCSWRTFKEGYKPIYVELEKYTAVVTNPLTWDADKPTAELNDNKGTLTRDFNEIKPGIVNAKIDGGVLWTVKPKVFASILLGKNYHIADYNFYYISIKENVQQRIDAFWKK